MASRQRTESTNGTPVPKKARNRKPGYYLAKIDGADDPVTVVARSMKLALGAVVSIRDATPSDLIVAGKSGYKVIDLTPKSDDTATQ